MGEFWTFFLAGPTQNKNPADAAGRRHGQTKSIVSALADELSLSLSPTKEARCRTIIRSPDKSSLVLCLFPRRWWVDRRRCGIHALNTKGHMFYGCTALHGLLHTSPFGPPAHVRLRRALHYALQYGYG